MIILCIVEEQVIWATEGNWAIQNADLILAVGTRISIRQTGYNWKHGQEQQRS